MKKKFTTLAQFVFPTIVIVKVLTSNVAKIKRADRVFINSQGFGHSVIDTIAYLDHYGSKSFVISLGTSMGQLPGTERNIFFDYYFDENAIIPVHVPTFFLTKYNWRFLHPVTKSILKMICFIVRNKEIVIDENNENINLKSLPNKISTQLKISVENSRNILSSMCDSFNLAENHYQSPHTINFLFKQPTRDIKVLDKYLNNPVRRKVNTDLENYPIVCLTIRRGNAPYHSNADYYFSAVELLHSKGFKTYLLGDKEYFFKFTKEKKSFYSEKIINYDVNKGDSKLLDLMAISKCDFVVGDQGGVWSLVSAFNKAGLIINGSCVAHLQYNVESLPRKWIYESTGLEFNDARTLFDQIFYRYKPVILPNGKSRIIQAENEQSLILKVIDRYTSTSDYLTQRRMQEVVSEKFFENKQIILAKNSSYAKEYIEELVF